MFHLAPNGRDFTRVHRLGKSGRPLKQQAAMPKQVAPNCADSSAPASSTFTRLNSRIGLSAFAMAANAYRSPARMCETGLQTNEDLLTPLIESAHSKIFMRTPSLRARVKRSETAVRRLSDARIGGLLALLIPTALCNVLRSGLHTLPPRQGVRSQRSAAV
jgi:hypothetical protein